MADLLKCTFSLNRRKTSSHPEGRLGISEGCITLVNQADFDKLAKQLRAQTPAAIPNTKTLYYGTVEVN